MEFSRPEYWSGQPFPSPGDLPNPGIKSRSPVLQADSLPAEPQGKFTIHIKSLQQVNLKQWLTLRFFVAAAQGWHLTKWGEGQK